jgi:hypothetical protein
MTSFRQQKFDKFQRDVLEKLTETNKLLEKVCAIMVSDQLLQECVSPSGEARTAEECAEIVNESFCAGMCLSEELDSHAQNFSYQKSEFFIDTEDNDIEATSDAEGDDSDEEDDDEENPPQAFSIVF